MTLSNDIKPAKMISETSGTKTINFETVMLNDVANSIGVIITSEDGTPCKKESDCGNNIAVAMDILTGLDLPVGTKFSLRIDFDTENNSK